MTSDSLRGLAALLWASEQSPWQPSTLRMPVVPSGRLSAAVSPTSPDASPESKVTQDS